MFESVSIRVMCLMVFFSQGCGAEDTRNVMGYISESVVLPSDADPSWSLSTIRWSIYENFTFIAVFQSKKENVDILPLFRGRLELNTSSGNLTIKNVSSSDALKYRVELIGRIATERKTSFVQLSVQERLGKPSIRLLRSSLDSGYCVISLGCLSKNSKVSLSWEPEHGFNEPFWSSNQGDSGESVLWTSFTPNRVVTFSCTAAADDRHQESSNKSVTCTEPEPRRNNTPPGCTQPIHKRSDERISVGFIAGFIGAMFGGFLVCLSADFFRTCKDGLCQPSGSSGSKITHECHPGSENTVNDAENPRERDGQRDINKSETQEKDGDSQPVYNNLSDSEMPLQVNDAENPRERDRQRDINKSETQEKDGDDQPVYNNLSDSEIPLQVSREN
ncbi:uncharacterized protein LOC108261138 isoform X1 [Ictalurus punctatus]|uniref:Uncharacterized protein LOC108261138 isoform X1 n=1 Tax=Ictalurus punctatus TaxID=7998 RepID=A0A9F7R8J4_ICTPU|nr:uncharacterized protein LOC108261138 isoform X1 [Ictalurus punctatus]